MAYAPIKKDVNTANRQANMPSYHKSYDDFDWQLAKAMIKGFKNGINMGYEAVDRHVEEGFGDQTALVFLEKKQQRKTFSYLQLQQMSNRFANLLKSFVLSFWS